VASMDVLDQQAVSAVGPAEQAITRVTGLTYAAMGIYFAMLARYGLRGVFSGKPWRLIVVFAAMVVESFSGFRSFVILFSMVFAVLFYLERMHHTRLLPFFVIGGLAGGTLLVAFANQLPFSAQRSLAFLPINIDPAVRLSATSSTGWRVQMWMDVLPEVPKHLILGKGYGFSGREMTMLHDAGNEGGGGARLAGDYHNGPLSVIMPFGLFGVFGFLWFMWAGLRAVYQNYQFGDPAYRRANTFLFAYFLVKIIFFFTVFGSLAGDLYALVGLVGLSISLNGGVAKPAVVPQPKVVFNRFRLHPSARRPLGA